jgi:hypothetical protein
MSQKYPFNLQFFADEANLVRQLLDFFDIRTTLSYARALRPQEYIGELLFPRKDVNTIDFDYFKESNRLPVMATLQNFDAETPIASREGIEKIIGEIAAIKRKTRLDERSIIALRREGLGDYETVERAVFGDIDKMVASVQARIEAMCAEVATTGKLTVAENGVVQTIDYGVPSDHQIALEDTELWSALSTATPITDIQTWTEKIVEDEGVRPTRALASSAVISYLLSNTQVRTMIWGTEGATKMVTLEDLNALLMRSELPQIGRYDQMARVEAADGTISTIRLMDTRRFTLLPPDTLGDTLYGPTAEALMNPELSVEELSGMFVSVTAKDEPPSIWTKAACTSIPTFPAANTVFQALVLGS